MAQKNKPTSDEHFIPQCYLKQFSADSEHIYQFDVISGRATPKPVPIKSICFEKNLYEFKNESGEFIHRNLIEDNFSKLEGDFCDTIKTIKNKATHKQNYHTLSFLTPKEKENLICFMSIQSLRDPYIINEVQDEIGRVWGDIITENSVRNLSIMSCVPIYKKTAFNERNLLNSMMKMYEDMSFQIGVSNKDSIITSDNPVILFGNFQVKGFDEVIFPLTSKIVIYMKSAKRTKFGFNNRLVELGKGDIEYVNKSIVSQCKRWIYSKNLLTNQQIQWIIRVRGGMKA